jgi:hypothetical protein
VQTLPFAVLVFPNPPVKVTAIVVMDGVSKDTMELSIRSCEALQERVVVLKLILCPRYAWSVGVWTIGGGMVTLTVDGIPWGQHSGKGGGSVAVVAASRQRGQRQGNGGQLETLAAARQRGNGNGSVVAAGSMAVGRQQRAAGQQDNGNSAVAAFGNGSVIARWQR